LKGALLNNAMINFQDFSEQNRKNSKKENKKI